MTERFALADLDALDEAAFGPMPGADGATRPGALTLDEAKRVLDTAMDEACFGPMPSGPVSAADIAEAQRVVASLAVPLHAGSASLLESRTASQVRCTVVESARVSGTSSGLLSVCLIDEGEGSSGFYPAATLEEAARNRVFGAGLHCYLDHPTESEKYERPERSVRDLAGVLESDAVFRDRGLHATVRVFPPHDETIVARMAHIGMSIRADGEVSERRTAASGSRVIEKLTKAHSVDFVTAAGRGGRILGSAA